MIDNSKLPQEIKDLLESNIRKKLLLILYDDKEKSAYSIIRDEDIDISISTVIEHLQKLEKAGLIEVKDASKGKLKRYHYKITKKGKKIFQEYYNDVFDEVKEYISIDETANSFNTIMVLEAIYNDESTNQSEIAIKTGLSNRTVSNIFWKLKEDGIIVEISSITKKKFKIMIDKEDLEKIIQHYKNAKNEINQGQKIFIKSKEKIAEGRSKITPFNIKR